MNRREFLPVAAAAASLPAADASRPNILWVTCEDMSPTLGCYGDSYVKTPNIDALAARGLRYTHVWSNAPVCAPARTTIITGMYPPSTGSEHMRSLARLPAGMKMFPQFLREAGYYCTNNNKEDYNLEKPAGVWDESSPRAHWRKRKSGQPFFAVFNFTITHESQIRRRPHQLKHDASKVRVPAYHPDRPEVRHDWAQYYDNIETMDGMVGKVLAELKEDGLDESTIVFFYSDHGSGMPRSKRWPFNSGLHVPMVIHIPAKFAPLAPPEYKAGGVTDRLVSFVDLAPTVLRLAGIQPAAYHQGHAFLAGSSRHPLIYGFRGRMDERYDMTRSVRDHRFVYLRHYLPDRVYGQHVAYMFETPTTKVWHKMHQDGALNDVQSAFWREKPAEELFDLEADPDETKNLVNSPEHKSLLAVMRRAQRELALKVRDTGFLPEPEIHSRSQGSTPYEMGHDPAKYPMEKILRAAEQATRLDTGIDKVLSGFSDTDSAVRYWAAVGVRIRKAEPGARTRPHLVKALSDSSHSVRIVAAEALGRFGSAEDTAKSLEVLLDCADVNRHGPYVAMMALNAIDYLEAKAAPAKERIRALPRDNKDVDQRIKGKIANLIEKILAGLA
ncbi:MAG: sulfatase [Acidobacteria bacterium]|nr:sulfatase [Acidobacteriota bacterium]